MLVLLDYDSRYPEAIPLPKVTFRNNAKELMLLFSLARMCLTDQGTPFISNQLYHINLLKRWIKLVPAFSAFATSPVGPSDRD